MRKCPKCGSTKVASMELIYGTCDGHWEDGHFEGHGDTDVVWDLSTTIGYECQECHTEISTAAELVGEGIRLLLEARAAFKKAGAVKTLARVKLAISSAYGAQRHARNAPYREERRSGLPHHSRERPHAVERRAPATDGDRAMDYLVRTLQDNPSQEGTGASNPDVTIIFPT